MFTDARRAWIAAAVRRRPSSPALPAPWRPAWGTVRSRTASRWAYIRGAGGPVLWAVAVFGPDDRRTPAVTCWIAPRRVAQGRRGGGLHRPRCSLRRGGGGAHPRGRPEQGGLRPALSCSAFRCLSRSGSRATCSTTLRCPGTGSRRPSRSATRPSLPLLRAAGASTSAAPPVARLGADDALSGSTRLGRCRGCSPTFLPTGLVASEGEGDAITARSSSGQASASITRRVRRGAASRAGDRGSAPARPARPP